jgi:AcrR family transcriptional regulator
MSDTKQHITQTALQLFMKKSYRNVTLKELVRASGLSKGAFYHYFESKEQLFKQVMDTYLFQYADEFDLENSHISSLKDLIEHYRTTSQQFVSGLHRVLGEDLSGFNLYRMMFDAMEYYPGFTEMVKHHHNTEFQSWLRIIEAAKQQGEIRADVDAENLARFFIYFYDGFGMRSMMYSNFNEFENTPYQVMMEVYEKIRR